MSLSIRSISVSLAFALATSSAGANRNAWHYAEEPLIPERPVEFKKFKKAGVRIPVHDIQRPDQNTLQFRIRTSEVNPASYLMTKSGVSKIYGKGYFGFTDPEYDIGRNTLCTYLSTQEGVISKEKEEDGTYLVTVKAAPNVLDSLLEQRCAISKSIDDNGVDEVEEEERRRQPRLYEHPRP